MKEQKHSIWLLRILCWVAFLGIPVFSSPDFSFDLRFLYIRPFQRDFLSYVLLLLFFYANYMVFLPRFYFLKKYLLFGFCLVGSFAVTTFLPILLLPGRGYWGTGMHVSLMNGFPPAAPFHHGSYEEIRHLAGQYFFQFIVIVVFSFTLMISARWRASEKARLDTELAYLKARINPHFLFNTLNSIYALAIEKSDHTPAAIVQLSGLMRYSISESVKDLVPLQQELNYINDYVALIRIRLDKHVVLHFDIEGDPAAYMIAPMVLITFIENAFKYGVNPDESSDITIRITINSDENNLTLVTRNKKINRVIAAGENSKLGIQNVKERLNHLYPDRHTLEILDEDQDFWIFLSIFMS